MVFLSTLPIVLKSFVILQVRLLQEQVTLWPRESCNLIRWNQDFQQVKCRSLVDAVCLPDPLATFDRTDNLTFIKHALFCLPATIIQVFLLPH